MELTREEFLNEYWKGIKGLCLEYEKNFNKVVGNNAYLCKKGVYNPTVIKERQMAKNLGIAYSTFLIKLSYQLPWEGLK